MGYQISGNQLDVLREIGNIGAGHAATSLSKLLNKRVDMDVPAVKLISFNEMMDLAGGAENIVASVFLRVEGDAPGSMFFVLPIQQANKYINQLLGVKHISLSDTETNDMAMSALQELGNILAGSYLSSLSDFTNLSLYPSVPGLAIDMFGAIISFGIIELSQVADHAIVIETSLNEDIEQDSQTVRGHFFLLPDPESIPVIFNSLGVKIDE